MNTVPPQIQTTTNLGPFPPRPDFPGGSDGKAFAYSAGDPGSIPGLERSPGEGNGKPLQYSCLGNSMDREAWWVTAHQVAEESDRTFRGRIMGDN